MDFNDLEGVWIEFLMIPLVSLHCYLKCEA